MTKKGKFIANEEVEIKTISNFKRFLEQGYAFENCTIQNIDFQGLNINWNTLKIANTSFLGCTFNIEEEVLLRRKGAVVFNCHGDLPYSPFRADLYGWQELMRGFSPEKDESYDIKIYEHFEKTKKNPTINEALMQRVHDHAMDQGIRELLTFDANGLTELKCVGFMGGHSTLRSDKFYIKTAKTAKLLAENGYFIVSGGGPGIMEATNLGAYFAGKDDADLEIALELLMQAPHYTHPDFHQKAMQVLEQYPDGGESLAIPTWFYGHEPSNLFASHIAKYFSNSLREDTLLAISLYGIVFSPGSAGTTQEIFQDATQNHYATFDYISPMIFLSKKRYEIDTLIFPLLKQLSYGRDFADMLFLTDEPNEVLTFLKQNPPRISKG